MYNGKPIVTVTALGDTGIEVYNVSRNNPFDNLELIRIVNYYAMILGINETEGMLYGPLPVAYHVEFLMYIYTLRIVNPHITDPRAIRNNKVVPASIIIFFSTSINGIASKCRQDVNTFLNQWIKQFRTVDDIKQHHLVEVEEYIHSRFKQEQKLYDVQEKADETAVVISKNLLLLQTLASKKNVQVSLLILNALDNLILMVKKAVLVYSYSELQKFEKNQVRCISELANVSLTMFRFSEEPKDYVKHIKKNQTGIFIIIDFSDKDSAKDGIYLLEQALSRTEDQTHISVVLFNVDSMSKLSEFGLTELLQGATGRSISLIDLSKANTSVEIALLDFFEQVAKKISKL